MTKHTLAFPITVEGKEISSVTIRRPKGRDMAAIGDEVANLARFFARNSVVMAQAAAEFEKAGKEMPDDYMPAEASPPDASVYKAMIAVAATLADLGDAAADLDMVDLNAITGKALIAGEAVGRGAQTSGDEQ